MLPCNVWRHFIAFFDSASNCVGKRSRHAHFQEGKREVGCNGCDRGDGYENGEDKKDRSLSDCDHHA